MLRLFVGLNENIFFIFEFFQLIDMFCSLIKKFVILFFLWEGDLVANNSLYYYSSPIKDAYNLSGTFAELRLNHFHTGIDYGTRGIEKLPVLAVADGFVSRVKIEAGGYGKAIYIEHPNGTSSVYAHLYGFRDTALHNYIKNQQYLQKSFAVDLFPEANKFIVRKDDIIAYSGNSGTSSAPHLHFEIRETKTQNPLNVMQKIPGLSDSFSPVFKKLYVYNEDSFEFGISRKKIYNIKSLNSSEFEITEIIHVPSTLSFGILVVDQISKNAYNGGLSKITVKMDTLIYFQQSIEQLSYNESRYINAHIDYEELLTKSNEVHRQLILPNNKLRFYNSANGGIIKLNDSNLHRITYVVEDFFGNKSTLKFKIKCNTFDNKILDMYIYDSNYFKWNIKNTINTDTYSINISAGTLFNNILFKCDTVKHCIEGLYSPVYLLQPEFTAFLKPFQFSIKPNREVLDSLKEKLLLVYVDIEKNKIAAIGGKFENNKVESNLRNFGYYSLVIDTTAPEVKPLFNPEKLSKINNIRFKISDNLSGIASYEVKIDGEWALFEYDLKKNEIFYVFDNSKIIPNKEHIIEIKVVDMKQNITFLKFNFFR